LKPKRKRQLDAALPEDKETSSWKHTSQALHTAALESIFSDGSMALLVASHSRPKTPNLGGGLSRLWRPGQVSH
jgi:hypothetical protein